jgi:hypothetical protein
MSKPPPFKDTNTLGKLEYSKPGLRLLRFTLPVSMNLEVPQDWANDEVHKHLIKVMGAFSRKATLGSEAWKVGTLRSEVIENIKNRLRTYKAFPPHIHVLEDED